MLLSKAWRIWLHCFLVLKLFNESTATTCTYTPMEEGMTGSLTCSTSNNFKNLTWQLKKDSVFVDVSTCTSQNGCQNLFQTFTASSRNSSNGTEYQSLLQISRVSRNDSTFKCVVDGGFEEVLCQIEVYVIPATPTCNQSVGISSKEVAVSCSTSRVYPEAICLFSYLTQSIPNFLDGPVSYKNERSPTNSDTATTCTLVVEVSGYKPGSYQLTVTMFPKVSKAPSTSGVTNNQDPVIILRSPTVVIAPNCPNGPSIKGTYINTVYSKQTTCQCQLVDSGVPPGQASWLDGEGLAIGITNTTDGSSTLTLSYSPNDPTPAYYCRGKTVLQTDANQIVYQPAYATGPDVINTEVSDKEFNLCPSDNKSITITCTVAANTVSPGMTFSVFIDSHAQVLLQQGQLTSTGYVYTYTYRPTKGGDSSVICRAENSVFDDIQARMIIQLSVREPPTTNPIIYVAIDGIKSYTNNATMKEGTSINVNCLVDGGLPLVQAVTLQCGDRQQEVQGNRATLTFKANRDMNGQVCLCSASHVSNCYNKVSQTVILFNIDNSGDFDSDNHVLIIGLSVGIGTVAVACVVVIAVFLIRRKSRRKAEQSESKSKRKSNNNYNKDPNDYVIPLPDLPPEPPESEYAEIENTVYDEPEEYDDSLYADNNKRKEASYSIFSENCYVRAQETSPATIDVIYNHDAHGDVVDNYL